MAPTTKVSVRVIGVPVITASTVYDSEEEKANRKRVVQHYAWLSSVQIPFSVLAMISGVISFGLGIPTASWPYFLNCFPYINGLTMLMAGWSSRIVGQTIPDYDMPSSVRTKVMVHFILMLNCLAASGLTVGFGIHGLVLCLSPSEQLWARCTPHHDALTAFVTINVALGGLLMPLSLVGLLLFHVHARTLDFLDPMTRMQVEVELLQSKVDALQRAQVVGAGAAQKGVQAGGGGGGGRAAGVGDGAHLPFPLQPPSYSVFRKGEACGYSGAQV